MLFKWFQRKRHAKGFGIHSPFAFDLVTNVIYEKHWYTAFLDIAQLLSDNNLEITDKKLNHLSYRLVRYFQSKKILELETLSGINTLYISSATKDVICHCFNPEGKSILMARNLHATYKRNIEFIKEIDIDESYDGIFVYPDTFPIEMEKLLLMSNDDTFWVIKGIKSDNGKRFWKKVVKDERARITFDMIDIGIVILKQSYNKQHYLI